MNWEHAHLVLNHVPVIGTVLAIALFAYGFLTRRREVERAALGTLALMAVAAAAAYFTGTRAEEGVERLAGVSESLIEAHEEAALVALIGIVALGAIALAALVLARRRPLVPKWMATAILLLALAEAGLLVRTANLGGRIRHPEIQALPGSGFTTQDVPKGNEGGGHDLD